MPKNNPEKKCFLLKKKYMPSNKKNVDGISENKILLNFRKVGEKEKNKAAKIAVFLLKFFNAIRYAKIMLAKLSRVTIISPNNTGSRPIFQKKPKIIGQINGLLASHKPTLPREKIYFPIPIYT